MAKKVVLDKSKFLAGKSIVVMVGGQGLEAKPREFSTGSLGYYANGKVLVEIDGQVCQLQAAVNLPICGTKPDKVETGE